MKLTDAVEDFMLACRADGLRPSTLSWYSSLLLMFKEAYPGRELESLTTHDLREYLVKLRTQTSHYNGYQRRIVEGALSEDTLKGHTRALHKFWRWCANEYGIQNPMRSVRYPRKPSTHAKPIALEDVKKMFQAAGSDVVGLRNRAIIAFLLDTGCRAAGIVGMKVHDLDLSLHRAIVIEKGQKDRSVVFTELTANLIRQWMAVRSPVPYLFYNSKTCEPMKPNGLYLMLKRLAERCGVERFNPHSFRHTFAREYIKSGGDLATLARLLGHNDMRTTVGHYAVFTDNEIAEKHAKLSPVRFLEGI